MHRVIALTMLTILVTPVAAASADLEQRVMQLEAREAIRALQLEYGRTLDARDWDAFSSLFARDGGTWDGGMGVAEGPAAIREMMVETIGTAPNGEPHAQDNMHIITNQQVTVTGADTAQATCKWIYVIRNADGGPRSVLVGHYVDELVREDGDWRFKYRKVYADMAGPGAVPEEE